VYRKLGTYQQVPRKWYRRNHYDVFSWILGRSDIYQLCVLAPARETDKRLIVTSGLLNRWSKGALMCDNCGDGSGWTVWQTTLNYRPPLSGAPVSMFVACADCNDDQMIPYPKPWPVCHICGKSLQFCLAVTKLSEKSTECPHCGANYVP